MKIKIENCRKCEPEGKIKAFLKIILLVDGFPLTISDVKIIDNGKGAIFYALPSKEYTTPEGEKKYFSLCSFFTKEGYAAFKQGMDDALVDYHKNVPSDLKEAAAEFLKTNNVPF